MKRYGKAITTTALLLSVIGSGVALADEPAAAAVPPAPATPAAPAAAAAAAEPVKYTGPSIFEVLDGSGITATGYAEVSWEHLSGTGAFSSSTADRVFDARHDSFTVNQAAITIAMQPKEGFGALVNLTAGQDAEIIKSYPNTGGSDFDVTQAFVQYATGPLTVMGGKFVTLAGVEVINATTNSNFSRSILFGYAIPFTHTGLRGTYVFSDQVSLTLGVNNGWDQLSDANKDKTVEFGLTLTPIKAFTFVVDGYLGKEPLGIVNNVATAAEGQRYVVDVVATWAVNDKFTIMANYDNGQQKDDTFGVAKNKYQWNGAAIYFNYALTDQWSASLRGEYFNDKDGYRTGVVDVLSGDGQKWKEATLTLAYAPSKHFVLRIEGRYDKSNIDGAFIKDTNSTTGALDVTDNQSSIALEGMYKF
jgi:Putative beta-barrel porin-2, OmpL-like. bbp2